MLLCCSLFGGGVDEVGRQAEPYPGRRKCIARVVERQGEIKPADHSVCFPDKQVEIGIGESFIEPALLPDTGQ